MTMAKTIAFFTILAVMLIASAADASYEDDQKLIERLKYEFSRSRPVCTLSNMQKVEEIFMHGYSNWADLPRLAEEIVYKCIVSIERKLAEYASTRDHYKYWLTYVASHVRMHNINDLSIESISEVKDTVFFPNKNYYLWDILESDIYEVYNTEQGDFQNDLCRPLQEGGELHDSYEIVKHLLEGVWVNLTEFREAIDIKVNYIEFMATSANLYFLGVLCENLRKQEEASTSTNAEAQPEKGEASTSTNAEAQPEKGEASTSTNGEVQPEQDDARA